jgi:hypothetical protein
VIAVGYTESCTTTYQATYTFHIGREDPWYIHITFPIAIPTLGTSLLGANLGE